MVESPSSSGLFMEDAQEEEDILAGSVERVLFYDEQTGFSILRVNLTGGWTASVKGHFPELEAGEEAEFIGRWQTHPVHGRQFVARTCRISEPSDPESLQRFLGSGLIPGVGPQLARRIVERFGQETIRILDSQPERLREVVGLKGDRGIRVARAWREKRLLREVVLLLANHGVGVKLAVRVYHHFGAAAPEIIRTHPYHLARDIPGVGFETADRLAAGLGIATDSPERLEAGVLHVLWAAGAHGHVYLPAGILAERAARLLGCSPAEARAVFPRLVEGGELARALGPAGEERIYDPSLEVEERELAADIQALVGPGEPDLAQLGASADVAGLSPEQAEAVRHALAHRLTVLTGGPGTGKTTTVRALAATLRSAGRTILLAAPTGKAARRLGDVTGLPAKTVHRLLGLGPGGAPTAVLAGDLVVVDEASMLDLPLAHALFRAVGPQTHVLLVGDTDQLPPVGPGDVLRALIASGVAPVIRLRAIYRQAARSGIIGNAHRVRQGEMPLVRGLDDFFFLTEEDPEKARDLVRDLVCRRLPKAYGLDPLRDLQVLAPTRSGALGVESLNAVLQEALNPPSPDRPEHRLGGRVFRTGDRVIALRNDYVREVFNGELGLISRVDPEDQVVEVLLDEGRSVLYEYRDLENLTHAYCLSVHRSQGSEFDTVVVALHSQHRWLLQRNLLYTALTRARRRVIVVGEPAALRRAVENAKPNYRFCGLVDRLRTPGHAAHPPAPAGPLEPGDLRAIEESFASPC